MYNCTICNKSFSQRGNLNTHMTLHSENRVTYKCIKCDRIFNHKSNYTKHMQNHDSPDFKNVRRKRHQVNRILQTTKLEEQDDVMEAIDLDSNIEDVKNSEIFVENAEDLTKPLKENLTTIEVHTSNNTKHMESQGSADLNKSINITKHQVIQSRQTTKLEEQGDIMQGIVFDENIEEVKVTGEVFVDNAEDLTKPSNENIATIEVHRFRNPKHMENLGIQDLKLIITKKQPLNEILKTKKLKEQEHIMQGNIFDEVKETGKVFVENAENLIKPLDETFNTTEFNKSNSSKLIETRGSPNLIIVDMKRQRVNQILPATNLEEEKDIMQDIVFDEKIEEVKETSEVFVENEDDLIKPLNENCNTIEVDKSNNSKQIESHGSPDLNTVNTTRQHSDQMIPTVKLEEEQVIMQGIVFDENIEDFEETSEAIVETAENLTKPMNENLNTLEVQGADHAIYKKPVLIIKHTDMPTTSDINLSDKVQNMKCTVTTGENVKEKAVQMTEVEDDSKVVHNIDLTNEQLVTEIFENISTSAQEVQEADNIVNMSVNTVLEVEPQVRETVKVFVTGENTAHEVEADILNDFLEKCNNTDVEIMPGASEVDNQTKNVAQVDTFTTEPADIPKSIHVVIDQGE